MASVDRVREALNKGESFAALAVTFSKAPEGVNGGDMGVRNVADYPALFADATAALAVGAVSAPVTSGAGVHLLKVLGRPLAKAQMTASQTRARHILLQTGPQLSEQQAVQTLRDVRAELLAGKRDSPPWQRRIAKMVPPQAAVIWAGWMRALLCLSLRAP